MRIPNDIPLAKWIWQLIKEDRVEQFYLTDDWRELRQDVLDDFHNECQECLKKGKVTTDELCVHHVNEVRNRPELALSRFFVDDKGQTQPNLVPLCKVCHNIIHEKLKKPIKKDKFINEERW